MQLWFVSYIEWRLKLLKQEVWTLLARVELFRCEPLTTTNLLTPHGHWASDVIIQLNS